MEKTRKFYRVTLLTKDPVKCSHRCAKTVEEAIKIAIEGLGDDLATVRVGIVNGKINRCIPFCKYNVKRNLRRDGETSLESPGGSVSITKKTVTKEEFLKMRIL